MTRDNRRQERHHVQVPCTVSYANMLQNPTRARIVNLSPDGLMLASEQGFIANERVSINLEDGYDALLFEFVETLTGIVRWSQAGTGNNVYHVGVKLERELPRRLVLTEQ